MAYDKILIGTWAWGAGYNGSKMVFGNSYDTATLKETFDEALNSGFMRWDTAAVYGMGSCETLLGGLINDRESLYISTKFMPGKKYKAGALTKSFEESMTRLKTTYADLFWIHIPHALEDNLKEAIPLMKSGRIKELGISNVSLAHIKTAEEILARAGLKLSAVQNHFSMLRNDQQPIIDYCNSKDYTYYAYMVLEQGALSGRYNAKDHFPLLSMRNFAFPKSKFKKIEPLLQKTGEIAARYGIDQSQVPILWVLGKGAVPIVGVTKPSHVQKLAKAARVELTRDDIKTLDDIARASGIRQQGMWEPQ